MSIATNNLTIKEKIKYIQKQALESWSGQGGIDRKNSVMACIRRFSREYAKAFNLRPLKILEAVENRRDYCAVNFYQDCNFPSLKDGVQIFETKKDFFNKFPSKKFTCPCCNAISTDPNTCNSGDLMTQEKRSKKGKITQKAEICNWKSYGLFGTMGKGYSFMIKEGFLEDPIIYDIFQPIELKND